MGKVCTVCNKEKPESEFYNDATHSDGKKSHCKVCHIEGTKRWRENNAARVSQYNKEYYNSHKRDNDAENQEG